MVFVCLLFFFSETSCGDPQMQTGEEEEEEGWEIVRRSKRR